MAVELWNKVNICYPSTAATGQISFNTTTANIIECLVSDCDDVLMLLRSEVLHTEISILYKILYVVNNSLRQHKPFRAIKQVAQCIKRLNEMKLHAVLQDLKEICPDKNQRDVGVDVGHCEVPSQPMLEWFCLKLLGASRLLGRTLDQCAKAFSLTQQHLRLAEFIVLNLVLTSMLSRLWVFFRGVLRTLVPVYQRTIELHKEVAQCWPMAFLTDFTLPGDLRSFLSPSHADLLEGGSRAEPCGIKRPHKASVLDKLFEKDVTEGVEGEKEEIQMMEMFAREGMNMDLGKAILREDPCFSSSPSGLDIQSMLHHRRGVTKQHAAEVLKMTSSVESGSSDPALDNQKKEFLKLLKRVTSFTEMAVQLKKVMNWCRRCQMLQKRQHLGIILLKCQRMKVLDHEGVSVQKKLQRMWKRVQQIMLKGTSLPKPSPSYQWRTRRCLRSRFATVMKRYGSIRNRVGAVRKHTQIAKDLFCVRAKSTQKSRKNINVQPLFEKLEKDNVMVSNVTQSEETKMEAENTLEAPPSKNNDEIDDIFASLGF